MFAEAQTDALRVVGQAIADNCGLSLMALMARKA
jgi:hypothetical protein